MHYLAKRLRAHSAKHPAIYVANLVLSFHYALLIYVNSSFLDRFMDERIVGLVFGIGSLISVFALLNVSKILKRISNSDLMMTLAFLEFFVVFGLAFSQSAVSAALFFILHELFVYLMYYSLDISLESVSRDESTGRTRAVFLTFANIMFVASPLALSVLVVSGDYSLVYFVSGLLTIPLFALVWMSLRRLRVAGYEEHPVLETVRRFERNKDLKNVARAQFLLNFFYAVMTVFMPIYLSQHLGYTWQDIGTIFAIMLIPFAIFEIPVGKIADEIAGEKEIMAAGFLIMSVATFFIPALPALSVPVWATVLFMTRVGASFVEATTESYFFKHVDASKADLIGFYRVMRPLAYGLGPVAGTVALFIIPYKHVFTLLSFVMLIGIWYSLRLKDTR